MVHLRDDVEPERGRRIPWTAIVTVAIFLVGGLVTGVATYFNNSLESADKHTAMIQTLHDRDADLDRRVAVLEAQRKEDSDRLRRIEELVLEVRSRVVR